MKAQNGSLQFRRLAAMLICAALLLASSPTLARDWTTKGGSPLRMSRAEEALGFMSGRLWWSLEDGQSAQQRAGIFTRPGFAETSTQPVVIGDTIYHVAGKHLWRIHLGPDGRPLLDDQAVATVNGQFSGSPRPNADPADRTADLGPGRTPASSPTYSPASGFLYWGTPYGELWAFDTRAERFSWIDVATPCKIVGSPLVMRINNRDVVIYGDRPVPDSPCTDTVGGNIWAVWGFEQESPRFTRYDDKVFGGWVTPSAVPVSPNEFMIGADNHGGQGVAIRLKIERTASDGFMLTKVPPLVDGGSGFAGSFASNGSTAYWLDVDGLLYIYKDDKTELPLIPPGARAFTNTEPAIGPDGAIYVTLRNYRAPDDHRPLRPDPSNPNAYDPGAPGALVKIAPDLAHVRLQPLPTDGVPGWYRAINTAPLVLHSPTGLQAVALGDVNGNLYLYNAADLTPLDAWKDGAPQAPGAISLLQPGETAARGGFTYSQRAGIGTDPMLASRLLMTGVNYTKPGDTTVHHRLVAYYNPEPYNLNWASAKLLPESPVAPGDSVTIDGQVRLTGPSGNTLTDLRTGGAAVQWFVLSAADWTGLQAGGPAPSLQALPAAVPLPATLANQAAATVAGALPSTQDLPPEGVVLGIIDLPKVAQYAPASTGGKVAAALGLAAATGASAHYETDYADNLIALPYQLQSPLNLALQVASTEEDGGKYRVTLTVTNTTAGRVTAPGVPLAADYTLPVLGHRQLPTRNIVIGPLETQELTYFVPGVPCGQTLEATFRLNPNPTPAYAETTYADNADGFSLTKPDTCNFTGGFVGGERKVLIVPWDCELVTDPNQRQICQNYQREIR